MLTFPKFLANSLTSFVSGAMILILTSFNFFDNDLIISDFLKKPSLVVLIKTLSLAFLNNVSIWSLRFLLPFIAPDSEVGSILSIPCL